MKFENKTRYQNRTLKALIFACVDDVAKCYPSVRGRTGDAPGLTADWAKKRGQFIKRACRVTVVYTRNHGRGCSGHASLGGGSMCIRLNRESSEAVELVWLIRHEVWHLFGIEHREMPVAANHRTDGGFRYVAEQFASVVARYAVDGRVCETPRPTRAKPTTDEKRARELDRTVAAIARWESKKRRAENALKKLRKRARYYEGVVAQAAKRPPSA